MDFMLFLLVTAIMIIRPTDFIPGLEGTPLYQIAIIPCILLSWHKLIPQLTTAGLKQRPVLVFGIGILSVSLVSNLAHGQLQVGFDFAIEFAKILIFYLLMLAHIDSLSRFKLVLSCLVGITSIPILLAWLNFHGYVDIPAFRVIVYSDGVRRLCGTGVFNDPNDVCEILNCAILLCLYGLLDRGGSLTRVLWLVPTVLFGHALSLTKSRGGLLGLMVGLMVLFGSRFRGMRSLVLAGVTLALVFFLFGGRQTSLSTSEDTAQSRIQYWDDGFQMLRGSPLIGVGTDRFAENAGGHTAHNSFILAFAELGFLGGTFLFGQFYYCLKNLAKLGSTRVILPDPDLRRVYPILGASLASFVASEMSLTNGFGLTSYMMLGLATAGIRLADPSPPLPDFFLSRTLVRRTIVYSGLLLVGLYIFTRLSVRYG
jgi:hypothetical protein